MYLTALYKATYRYSYAIIFAKPAFAFLSLLPYSFVSMCYTSSLNSIISLPSHVLSSISKAFPSFSSFFLCLYLALNILFSILSPRIWTLHFSISFPRHLSQHIAYKLPKAFISFNSKFFRKVKPVTLVVELCCNREDFSEDFQLFYSYICIYNLIVWN